MTTTNTAPQFPARRSSPCPACHGTIAVGQLIAKGDHGYQHVDCSAAATPVPVGPRDITVERVGRRSYFRGDTYAVRSMLSSNNCHWDGEQRAWWIGSHETALELAERARTAPAEAPAPKRITHCLGCGGSLDRYQQQRGFRFCSRECAIEKKMGSGWSGHVPGYGWHQGSDD